MIKCLLSACLLYFTAGCSRFDRVVGNSLETGNAFSGIVINESGSRVKNASVTLYPANYDPESGGKLKEDWTDKTNSRGEYNLYSIPPGEYNILVRSPEGTETGLLQHIGIDPLDSNYYREYRVPTVKVQTPANLTVFFDGLVKEPGGYLFLSGTDMSRQVADTNVLQNKMHWKELPPGRFGELFYQKPGSEPAENILTAPLSLEPGGISNITAHGAWSKTQKIYINTTGRMTEDLVKYPLILLLNDENFDFSAVRKNAEDIRVLNASGENLPFEIKYWDKEASEGRIHILLDTLYKNTQSQYVQLLWGNGDCRSYENTTPVFPEALGYMGVYHFENFPSASNPVFEDNSETLNTLTMLGAEDGNLKAEGIVGSAVRLNGSSQALYSKKAVDNPNTFTLSLWINTVTGHGGKIIGFGSEQKKRSAFYDRQIWMDSSGYIHFGLLPRAPAQVSAEDSAFLAGTYIRRILSSGSPLNDGKWHQVAAVLSSTGMALYVDGVMEESRDDVSQGQDYTGYWRMGWDDLDGWEFSVDNLFFEGLLDEIQISNANRSAGWIYMQYLNEGQPLSIFTFGAVEDN